MSPAARVDAVRNSLNAENGLQPGPDHMQFLQNAPAFDRKSNAADQKAAQHPMETYSQPNSGGDLIANNSTRICVVGLISLEHFTCSHITHGANSVNKLCIRIDCWIAEFC